jgi:cytoskeletal protein RodZ
MEQKELSFDLPEVSEMQPGEVVFMPEEEAEIIVESKPPLKFQEVESDNDSFGKKLQRIRKAKKMNITDIADQLCLSVNVIKDVEAERYLDDKSDVYQRGYVRSYARLLGVPFGEIDEYFANTGIFTKDNNSKPFELGGRQLTPRDKNVKLVTYAVTGVMALLVLVWWGLRR